MEEIKDILDIKLKNNDINLVKKILSFVIVDCSICKKKSTLEYQENWDNKFYCQRCFSNPKINIIKCVGCFKYYLCSNHLDVCNICLKNCNIYCCGCLENIELIDFHCNNHSIYFWFPLTIYSDTELDI